jgi:hypothetical protein
LKEIYNRGDEMSEMVSYQMDGETCKTECIYNKFMVGSWGCKKACHCTKYDENKKYVICNYADVHKNEGGNMSTETTGKTEKPKLTREHAREIWAVQHYPFDVFIHDLHVLGYMEKPETALERAERLYNAWDRNGNYSGSSSVVINMATAYREAIKELQTALEAAKGVTS